MQSANGTLPTAFSIFLSFTSLKQSFTPPTFLGSLKKLGVIYIHDIVFQRILVKQAKQNFYL
jgi:hypothetical protein